MKLTATEPDIRTLVDRIDRDDIDLQPDFQRQEVWSVKKKKRLIDTILRGWSIPPIHLVETSDNRAEVLDGQQRLAALRDFIHGKFSIDGKIEPVDPAISALNGRFFNKLEPAVRRRIEQYPLRCFRITDYGPEEPSELFYRLNQPTILTAGEQRNALYGDARKQLKAVVHTFQSDTEKYGSLGFSNLRLAYDDIFARLLFFIELGSFGIKGTESRVSDRFRSGHGFDAFTIARVEAAISFFSMQRSNVSHFRFNKASALSWLMFLSRFEADPDDQFLAAFIDASEGRYTAHYLTEAAALFEDRSSLRVTDVSSVTYRDFVLNYMYSRLGLGPLPEKVRSRNIDEIELILDDQDLLSFEEALADHLDITEWSSSL